ncbi:MAG: hypothetical protein AAFO94_03065 [Bacteroidota bacterium]
MDRATIVELLAQVQNGAITNEDFLSQLQDAGVDSYNISLADLKVRFMQSEEQMEESVHLLHRNPKDADNLVLRLLKKAGVDNYDVSLTSGNVTYYDDNGDELIEGNELWRSF